MIKFQGRCHHPKDQLLIGLAFFYLFCSTFIFRTGCLKFGFGMAAIKSASFKYTIKALQVLELRNSIQDFYYCLQIVKVVLSKLQLVLAAILVIISLIELGNEPQLISPQ